MLVFHLTSRKIFSKEQEVTEQMTRRAIAVFFAGMCLFDSLFGIVRVFEKGGGTALWPLPLFLFLSLAAGVIFLILTLGAS